VIIKMWSAKIISNTRGQKLECGYQNVDCQNHFLEKKLLTIFTWSLSCGCTPTSEFPAPRNMVKQIGY
jgi:hypothetical protein